MWVCWIVIKGWESHRDRLWRVEQALIRTEDDREEARDAAEHLKEVAILEAYLVELASQSPDDREKELKASWNSWEQQNNDRINSPE